MRHVQSCGQADLKRTKTCRTTRTRRRIRMGRGRRRSRIEGDIPAANPVQNEVTNRGEDDAFGQYVPQKNVRPKRNAKPPAKLRDFVQTVL
jgi:hypothetical protein